MDRVEQFVRIGTEEAQSPWQLVFRKLIFNSLLCAVIVVFLKVMSGTHGYLLSSLFLFVFLFVILVLPSFMRGLFGRETKLRIKTWKRRPFSHETYAIAAQALREFKTVLYEQGIAKYGEDVLGILLLSDGICFEQKYYGRRDPRNIFAPREFSRLVSIKAIEEDRAAGPEDDWETPG